MGNYSCAACGAKNPHSMIRCGKYRAYICDKHCNGCEFFSSYETSVVHCYYREKKLEAQKKAELLKKQLSEEKE